LNLLILLLAGGKGTRIKHLLDDDEKIKPMLKVERKRLIDHVLHTVSDIDADKKVLTYPSREYDILNTHLRKKNIPMLFQRGKQRKLPTILELPYLLFMQYFLSDSKKELRSYDAILTMPCDILTHKDEMEEFIARWKKTSRPGIKEIHLFSRETPCCDSGDYFMKDSRDVITRYRSKKPKEYDSDSAWIHAHQSGIYIFSANLLRNPLTFVSGLKNISTHIYLSTKGWIDYGTPQTVEIIKQSV
jgi:NDP-sugar pyrophosphorylase family protein